MKEKRRLEILDKSRELLAELDARRADKQKLVRLPLAGADIEEVDKAIAGLNEELRRLEDEFLEGISVPVWYIENGLFFHNPAAIRIRAMSDDELTREIYQAEARLVGPPKDVNGRWISRTDHILDMLKGEYELRMKRPGQAQPQKRVGRRRSRIELEDIHKKVAREYQRLQDAGVAHRRIFEQLATDSKKKFGRQYTSGELRGLWQRSPERLRRSPNRT